MYNISNLTLFGNISRRIVFIEMPLDIILYGSIFYIIIFLIGIIGNLLVIYVLTKEKELRNFTNYLLANLSVADLMVLFTCVPSALHDLFAKERWYLGKIMCYLIGFIENCMGIASILSMLMITLERYYVICMPLKVKSVMTQSRTLKILSLIWLVSILVNLPFIFLAEYKLVLFYDNNKEDYKCSAKPGNQWTTAYSISITFIVYVLIGVVLLAMYNKITGNLKKSTKAFQSPSVKQDPSPTTASPASPVSPTSPPIAQQPNKHKELNESLNQSNLLEVKSSYFKSSDPSLVSFENKAQNETLLNINYDIDKYIKPRKQLIVMLMWIIVIFYVCLFPLKIWHLILFFFGHRPAFLRVIQLRQYWYISITCRILFYANSSVNPILYNCLSKKFRDSFKRLYIFRVCFGKEIAEAERARRAKNSSIYSTKMNSSRRQLSVTNKRL